MQTTTDSQPAAGCTALPKAVLHEGGLRCAHAALLQPGRRLDTCDGLVGNETGVGASTVGVEFQPLGFAPFGEIVRVQVNADYAPAFCLESFAASFGGGQPLIVGPMEFVAILKHGAQPDVVLALEPDHAGSLNGSHTASIEVTDTLIVTAQPAKEAV